MTLAQRLYGYTKTLPTKYQRQCITCGLSPWSQVNRCDLCASVPRYMRKRHLPETLVQHGRWMLHPACVMDAMANAGCTMALPRLDYGPLAGLTPPMQLALMKQALLDDADERAKVLQQMHREARP